MNVNTDAKKIEELSSRGVEDIIVRDNFKKKLFSGRKLKIKFGIDPTSPVIHLGNAIPLWKLRQFQELGHQIILIIGDFTAQIGDTSDKTSPRQPLSRKQIAQNLKGYKKQITKILDLNKTKFVFNSEWLDDISFEKILQLTSQFTVAQMIERENFSNRYKAGKPIGLQEFLYPILQGYDSVAVKADIEIGGTDQTFNMLAGRTLQKFYKQAPQDVMTLPLIEGTDGRKMSKSFGNTIGIFDKPNEMFGKIMSMADEFIVKYFFLCTAYPLEKIKDIEIGIKEGRVNPRDAKARLAKEIVSLYYNNTIGQKAEDEFNAVFKKKKLPEKISEVSITEKNINILDLLVRTKLIDSKSEAKRIVMQKGVRINGIVQDSWQSIVAVEKGTVIQVGKRKFVKIS